MPEDRYPAALYALLHRGNPGDVAFYARQVRGARAILELGCGYGRLIPSLAKSGAAYQGLDLSAALLRMAQRVRRALPVAQRRHVHLRQGDMRDFQFRTRFDRILLPHSALYCLPSQRDVLRCLRAVRAHLADDGEFLLDAYFADDFHRWLDPARMTGKERDYLTTVEGSAGRYLVFERTRWLRASQRFVTTYEYESERGKLERGVIRHHYLLRDQLLALLERAGFTRLNLAGDFAGGRLNLRSEHLVLRAQP